MDEKTEQDLPKEEKITVEVKEEPKLITPFEAQPEPQSPTPQLKKGEIIFIEDYAVQPVKKEAKRINLFNIVSTMEPRLLTVLDGCLYVFKPVPNKLKPMQHFNRFFAKELPNKAELEEQNKQRASVQSCSELERLFKVDISAASQ